MPLDLASLKRRASVTHNKSLPEQARDAELLEVIAALERAVGLLREVEWRGATQPWDDPVIGCFSCGNTEREAHDEACRVAALLAAFPPPGGEGA